MSRFKFTPDTGYQYDGEAGDYGSSCRICDQFFEAPAADLAQGAADACAANDLRGSDFHDGSAK